MHNNINPSLTIKKAFNNWLIHKNSDWGMENFRSRKTMYVGFLHIIDLDVLEQILSDLISIYKKYFPSAGKQDFIDYTFGFTLFDLERFITRDLIYLGSPTIDSPFEYYYCSEGNGEIIDFAIPRDFSIQYYKQYYSNIIEVIRDVPWNKKITPQSERLDQIEQSLGIIENQSLSVLEWATIFYYVESKNLLPEAKSKLEKMKRFINDHNKKMSLNNFKNQYHKAVSRINEKNDYPINKLKAIIPYLEENYPDVVPRVEGDINFISTNLENL